MLRKGTRASIKTRGLLGDKYIELEGGRADEPEVPDRREHSGGAGRGHREAPRGQRRPADRSVRDRQVAADHPRPNREGRGIPGIDHLQQRGERAARQQLQRRAPLPERHPRQGQQRTGSRRPAPHRREVRQGHERGPRGRVPLGRVAARPRSTRTCAPARARSRRCSRIRRARRRSTQLVDTLAAAAASLARTTENLEKGKGALPDPAPRRAVREGVHREPAQLLEEPGFDRPQARRRHGNGRQAHQRPLGLRRRPEAGRRRRSVGSAALAHQGPAEVGDPQGVPRLPHRDSPAAVARPDPDAGCGPMKLLITGGAGFIGSHVADRRLGRGDRVVVLDDFNDYYDPRRKRANVAAHLTSPRYRLVEGDIRDRALVFRLFAEEHFDAVVHLAARAGVRPSLEQPVLYEEVNCVGDAAPPGGGRRARKAALRVRLLVVGLRDQLEAPVRGGRSDRAADLALRHHETRRASCTCSRPTISTVSRRPACGSSPSTGRASARRWRSRASSGASRRTSRFRSSGTAARAGTTPTSTTSPTASRRPWRRTSASRSSTSAARIRSRSRSSSRRSRTRPASAPALERVPEQPGDVPVTFASVEKAQRVLGFRARGRARGGPPARRSTGTGASSA